MTRLPSPEQQVILDSRARVRIVRAAPGSGKTWLVAEAIRQELSQRTETSGGIAALSFTRVGGEEVRNAIGHALDHPHFVGTIDSFLYRFIVRPFFKRAYPDFAAPRLIPADWAPSTWSKGPGNAPWTVQSTINNKRHYNLFDVCFWGEDGTETVLSIQRPFQGGYERVAAADREAIGEAKRRCWNRFGWLTHSDVSFIASKLLGNATFGATIQSVLLQRFPLLVVDELQDTGYFMGKCLRLLLKNQLGRGLLVGDPDQAIFEFNGARPDLFSLYEQISGSVILPLATSRRCPQAVVAVASHLKSSNGALLPAPGDAGNAILVPYNEMAPDIHRVAELLRTKHPTGNIQVVVRRQQTIDDLTGRRIAKPNSLHSQPLNHAFRAVCALRQGTNAKALAIARAAIDLAVFGHEGSSDETLVAKGIDPALWKAAVAKCLIFWHSIPMPATLYQWQTTAGQLLDQQIAAIGLPHDFGFITGKIRPQHRDGEHDGVEQFLPAGLSSTSSIAGVSVQTVHGVKGETHDITVFVCPPEKGKRPSFVDVWWSDTVDAAEEKRIAFVAMTRPRATLILCVHAACLVKLAQTQQAFLKSFRCSSVEQLALTC